MNREKKMGSGDHHGNGFSCVEKKSKTPPWGGGGGVVKESPKK